MNSMFELATQDEIDKLRTGDGSKSGEESSESLELDDLEVTTKLSAGCLLKLWPLFRCGILGFL